MADDTSEAEPMFRASKRRKMLRKRAEAATTTTTEGDDHSVEREATEAEGEGNSVPRVAKRAMTKKHGISFVSAPKPQREEAGQQNGAALVPLPASEEQEPTQTDRFVKPTGRAVIVDDQHMMAFVDSRLAEMRSASATPTNSTENAAPQSPTTQSTAQRAEREGKEAEYVAGRNTESADAPNRSTYVRPEGPQRSSSRRKPTRPDQGTIARSSLVDQIMQESTVPLYDRPIPDMPSYADDGTDNDEAAAAAFKKQFLADLEARTRRKPAGHSSAGSKGTSTSTGPKLGGSRSQREKMKAAQEASKNEKK